MNTAKDRLEQLSQRQRIYAPDVRVVQLEDAIEVLECERKRVDRLIREAYNALSGSTGLTDEKRKSESSLSRRLRLYLAEQEGVE